jgi:hypothetical protein
MVAIIPQLPYHGIQRNEVVPFRPVHKRVVPRHRVD